MMAVLLIVGIVVANVLYLVWAVFLEIRKRHFDEVWEHMKPAAAKMSEHGWVPTRVARKNRLWMPEPVIHYRHPDNGRTWVMDVTWQ